MPGRTSRVSSPPATSVKRSPHHPSRSRRASEVMPPAASPEPMSPRSSDDEAERPRFVAPEDAHQQPKPKPKRPSAKR